MDAQDERQKQDEAGMAAKPSHVHDMRFAQNTDWSLVSVVLKLYSKLKVPFWFAIASATVYVGYEGRGDRAITAEAGLGYWLGIFSAACMVILLIYPLRKRLKFLSFIGATRDWFRNHQVLGIIGPIAALYHCNFYLGSMNSRIALYSALVVAGSGIVGRFIYTKIFRGLNGRKASLKELASKMHDDFPESAKNLVFLPELMNRVAEFDSHVLSPPKSIFDCFSLPFKLIIATRREQWRLAAFSRRKIMVESIYSEQVQADRRKIQRVIRRYIARHLSQVRQVAEFTAYQRLFALWHKVHLPFFILLVITVIVHVYAVHSY